MLDQTLLQLALSLLFHNAPCDELQAPKIHDLQSMRDRDNRQLVVGNITQSQGNTYHLVWVVESEGENLVTFLERSRGSQNWYPNPGLKHRLSSILDAQEGSKICTDGTCTPMSPYSIQRPSYCDLEIYNPNAYQNF